MPWLWKRISRKCGLNNWKVHVAMAREKASWKSLVWIGSSQTTSREGQLNNSKVQKPFYKTLLFMVSAFNFLNLLLSKISRIYFLWFYQFDCKYFIFGSVLFRLQIFYVVSVLFCSVAIKPFIACSIWIISSPLKHFSWNLRNIHFCKLIEHYEPIIVYLKSYP